MKREVVVDYEIHGTMCLSVRHVSNARLRAESLLSSAIHDLQEVSVYCEPDIHEPIDAQKRYGRRTKSRLERET